MVITWVYSHWWSFGTWGVKTGAFSGDQRMNIAAIFIWLVVWNMNFIFHILEIIIIPTDELIFFRGVGIPPSSHVRFWGSGFLIHTDNPAWLKRCCLVTKVLDFLRYCKRTIQQAVSGCFGDIYIPIDNGLAFRPPNHFFGDTQIKNQEYD